MTKLTPTEIDIATIAAHARTADRTLDILNSMATAAGLSVTLVAGGVVISGDLSTDVKWGKHLDEAIQTAFKGDMRQRFIEAGVEEGEGLDKLVATFESSFKERAESLGDRESEHIEKMLALGEDIELRYIDDAELVRDQILYGRSAAVITLVNARVYVGRHTWEAGTMRVLTAQIAAWWPGRPS